MNKKYIYKSIIIVALSSVFFVVSIISAYLLFFYESDNSFTVGEVLIDVDPYFIVNGVRIDPVENVSVKDGVIILNITDTSEHNFFDNFRVDIIVKSNVETYFRVIMYEQFTLTTGTENKTEIAITREEYSNFKFNEEFYDNRENDDYFYYKNKVKVENSKKPKAINFITKNKDYSHPIYNSKYTIKIGFVVEAVQALEGPEINWGLPTKPWDNLKW